MLMPILQGRGVPRDLPGGKGLMQIKQIERSAIPVRADCCSHSVQQSAWPTARRTVMNHSLLNINQREFDEIV